jgi:SET domain-containing protein
MVLIKKKSKIHGIGIFTNKKISKGEVFYKIPLDKVHDKPTEKFAYIGNGKWVEDPKVLNWVNHSCTPNTILNIKGNQPVLMAKRDILPREEITCDYSLTEKEGELAKCTCKSQNCRRCIKYGPKKTKN